MVELRKISPDITSKQQKNAQVHVRSRLIGPILAVVLLPLFILLIIGSYIAVSLMPLRDAIPITQSLLQVGRETTDAIKNQDLQKMKEGLSKTRIELTKLKDQYKKAEHLTRFPVLGKYIEDGSYVLEAGFNALDAGDKAVEALEPNADLLGLKGTSRFVSGSAEERIQVAVKTLVSLTPKIKEIATDIDKMRSSLDKIEPSDYPEYIRDIPVRSKLLSYKQIIDNAANLFVNAQPIVLNLPKMLGEPVTKRYLVLLQNDAELRPTGGFITAYAMFRLEKGKITLERSDDIYSLDNAKKQKFPAPREISEFHKGVYELYIRDSNLNPDYKLSMDQFLSMYKSTAGYEKIDGIWAVDTHILVEILKILGPMTVDGKNLTAEIDKRCDCAQAIYVLEDDITRPVGYIKEDRKGIIGRLLEQLMKKALGVSPSQYWGRLFQMLLVQINEKHVLAYFTDPELQSAVESFNLAGRMMTVDNIAKTLKYEEGKDWDYLHVNNSNMAGAKSNLFTRESYVKDVQVSSNGMLATKLTIEYRNNFPASDCNLERGGLCLNAPLRNWVRIFVPKGSTLTESKGFISPKDGKPVTLSSYDMNGKAVFEGFLIINPQGQSKVELSYTTPLSGAVVGKYKLFVQKQPGTDGVNFTVHVNGSDLYAGELKTDTEFMQ